MAENVIDTLKLDIIVNTKQNGQSITTLRNSLEKLYKFLNGVKDQDFSKISNDIAKIGGRLTPLVNAINSLDGQGLKNLTSLGTRLKTLDKRMGEIDAKAMAHKFDLMTQSITPFIDKVMSAQEALVALNNVMGGAKTLTKTATPKATTTTTPKATANTNILGGKLGKSLNFGSMVAKLYFVRNITKQLGQNLAKVVQYGIDYEETLNLWQVAMRGNISQARTFVSEMRNAYGIASATLMNYQATFKNMLSALDGLNEDVAYGLSEALTGMALDYASLYNTSIESAMTKFQAVLAGQVRPIRSESGYDITESTIFSIYQELGGTKSVRQLDQMEKRLLRILAVYKQMQGTATGDLAKTITSSANQLRVMKEQAQEFATWIGVAFNTLLEKSGILIEINAYLYALSALAEQFAISLGYVEKDYSIKEPIDEANTALDGANEKVDELQGKLLGFDKFQVLSTGNVDNGNVDLAAEITKAIQEYERIINDAENPAFKRSLELLQAWGLELGENGKIVGGFDKVKERVTDIAKSLGGIIAFIGLMTKPWMVLVGAIEYAYWTNEEFRNSFNGMIKAVGSSGITIFRNFAEILKDISPALTAIVGGFANVISFLDRIGLLEFAIWGVVTAMIAWKTAQAAINIMKFYENIVKYLVPAITSASLAIRKQLAASLIAAQLNFGKFGLAMTAVTAQTIGFAAAIGLAFAVFTNWEYMNGMQKIVSVLGVLTVALLSAAIAFGAFHSAWSLGLAIAGIAAGIVAVTAAVNSAKANIDSMEVPKYAKGGLADKGSLFYAGEAGPELVTQTSGGGSTIMNMKQLEDAVARGFIRGFAATDNGYENDDTTEVYVDGQRLFNIMRNTAKRNGYDFVRV